MMSKAKDITATSGDSEAPTQPEDTGRRTYRCLEPDCGKVYGHASGLRYHRIHVSAPHAALGVAHRSKGSPRSTPRATVHPASLRREESPTKGQAVSPISDATLGSRDMSGSADEVQGRFLPCADGVVVYSNSVLEVDAFPSIISWISSLSTWRGNGCGTWGHDRDSTPARACVVLRMSALHSCSYMLALLVITRPPG